MKRSTFLKGLVGVPIVVAGGILLKEEETIVDSPIEKEKRDFNKQYPLTYNMCYTA